MSANVFANGREISAKKAGNKSICAMPDVCLSPPSPPAGPIPIPYPNTSDSKKTSGGSKSVKIGGKEVGLKNKSNYKKSNGDEAATKSLGMGVISHQIQGKMKHAAWSMDVKVEGKNVIRHMDLTTHNHMNCTNGAVTLDAALAKFEANEPLSCEELDLVNQNARDKELTPAGKKGPVTLTTASRTNPSGTKNMKAVSEKIKVKRKEKGGYAPTNNKETMSCTDKSSGGEQYRNHTEPKLIEPEFEGGGTMKMKIHHQFKKDGKLVSDSMPCPKCREAICAAESCGLNIILCNDKNEEKKPACNEDGTPKPEKEWKDLGL